MLAFKLFVEIWGKPENFHSITSNISKIFHSISSDLINRADKLQKAFPVSVAPHQKSGCIFWVEIWGSPTNFHSPHIVHIFIEPFVKILGKPENFHSDVFFKNITLSLPILQFNHGGRISAATFFWASKKNIFSANFCSLSRPRVKLTSWALWLQPCPLYNLRSSLLWWVE